MVISQSASIKEDTDSIYISLKWLIKSSFVLLSYSSIKSIEILNLDGLKIIDISYPKRITCHFFPKFTIAQRTATSIFSIS